MYNISAHNYLSAYGAAALLGVGGSTLLVTVLTMLADLIGENVVSWKRHDRFCSQANNIQAKTQHARLLLTISILSRLRQKIV